MRAHAAEARVFTGPSPVYRGMDNHTAVNHSTGEYVRGDVLTNGIESLLALLMRGDQGVHHWMSAKHLHR